MNCKLKKLLSYYKPYKKTFALDLFFSLLQSVVVISIPLVVKYIINTVVLMPTDEAIRQTLILAGAILILLFIQLGCNFFTLYYGHIIAAKIEKDMRLEIFSHYQRLPFSFFDCQSAGELLSRITVDLNNISEFLHHIPEELLNMSIRLIGVLFILFSINIKFAFIFLEFFPIIIVFVWIFVSKTQKAFLENHQKISEINSQVEENLLGIRTVKAFSNENLEIEKFEEKNSNFVVSKRKSFKIMAMTYSGIMFFMTGFLPIVVITGLLLHKFGQLPIEDLLIFILCEGIVISPVSTLVALLEQSHDTIAGYRRFIEILKEKPEANDLNCKKTEIKGTIEFSDVSFSYSETSRKILSNINFKINAGQYVAIVGHSGVGKSTICNLISRFYNVCGGKIFIDNTDIKNINLETLRKSIGFIQQNATLFSGTILENILYGNPEASREEVIEAAKKAYANDFIMNLPEKYETKIGQNGIKLSGGQKQRIAIARVFIKNPAILIFDEATSNLDSESEKCIQKSMNFLCQNRTTIIISHRLSTIKNAEKIFVLSDEGKISEEGTHQELIEKNGIYSELYKLL